uniref:Secreted protein n=1 Tax=Steinernema glaseri TaxID=37863 RepID=A0A1I7YQM1_9BILA
MEKSRASRYLGRQDRWTVGLHKDSTTQMTVLMTVILMSATAFFTFPFIELDSIDQIAVVVSEHRHNLVRIERQSLQHHDAERAAVCGRRVHHLLVTISQKEKLKHYQEYHDRDTVSKMKTLTMEQFVASIIYVGKGITGPKESGPGHLYLGIYTDARNEAVHRLFKARRQFIRGSITYFLRASVGSKENRLIATNGPVVGNRYT